MNHRQAQRGYTLIELIATNVAFAAVVMCVGIIYAVIHFVTKFW